VNKPTIFAFLAMMLYAATNVVLEEKFSKFNNLTIMCIYVLPVVLVAFVGRWLTKTSDPSFDFPVGNELIILIVLGFMWAAADYFYIGAYTNGGSLLTITSIMVMFPAVASIIKLVWTHGLPNMWQVSGYLLAACGMILVAKGSTAT